LVKGKAKVGGGKEGEGRGREERLINVGRRRVGREKKVVWSETRRGGRRKRERDSGYFERIVFTCKKPWKDSIR